MTSRKKSSKKQSKVPFFVGGGILLLLVVALLSTGLGGDNGDNGDSTAQEIRRRLSFRSCPARILAGNAPISPSACRCRKSPASHSTVPRSASPTTAGPRSFCCSPTGDRDASPRSRTIRSTSAKTRTPPISISIQFRPAPHRVAITTRPRPGWNEKDGRSRLWSMTRTTRCRERTA